MTSLFKAKIICLLIVLKMFEALYLKALEVKNKSLFNTKKIVDILIQSIIIQKSLSDL